jgi:8-oxo-dGTP diphosphatase
MLGMMHVQRHRVAVYVVCLDLGDRIALTQYSAEGDPDSGKWALPGGAVEWPESAHDTAKREVSEETGLEVVVGSLIGVHMRWSDLSGRGELVHQLMAGVLYQASPVNGSDLRSRATSTTSAAAWFELHEVPRLPRLDIVDYAIACATGARPTV